MNDNITISTISTPENPMITIYEYDRISGPENTYTLLAADEGHETPDRWFTPIRQVRDAQTAREYMLAKIEQKVPTKGSTSHLPEHLQSGYVVEDVAHVPAWALFGIEASNYVEPME